MKKLDFINRPERYHLKHFDKNLCRITKIDSKSASVLQGMILNLSKSGLLLQLSYDNNFKVNDKLLLEFEIPYLKSTIIAEVEIKRAFKTEDDFYFGVSFLGANNFLQDSIEVAVTQSLQMA